MVRQSVPGSHQAEAGGSSMGRRQDLCDHVSLVLTRSRRHRWVVGVMPGIESPHPTLPPAEMGTAQQENPVDYTPVGQVIAPYVSLAAIFIAAFVIGYVTD